MEIVHKLRPADPPLIIGTLADLENSPSNPNECQDFLERQLLTIIKNEELLLATAPLPMSKGKEIPHKDGTFSTGLNVMTTGGVPSPAQPAQVQGS